MKINGFINEILILNFGIIWIVNGCLIIIELLKNETVRIVLEAFILQFP